MTFDPNDWARRFLANADEAERNSLMDSGWSGTVATNCTQRTALLYRELFEQLATVELRPEDFFDRPALAAVAPNPITE
jgi:hypothetical protein